MPKILSIAFGSSVSAVPAEISFSGHEFHLWAILEMIAYVVWYWLYPASFILAVSLCFTAVLSKSYNASIARFACSCRFPHSLCLFIGRQWAAKRKRRIKKHIKFLLKRILLPLFVFVMHQS
jgi:hypothetical protein